MSATVFFNDSLNASESQNNFSGEGINPNLTRNAGTLRIVSLTFTFTAITYLVYVIIAMTVYAVNHKYLRSKETGKRRSEAPHVIIIFGLFVTTLYVSTELPLLTTQVDPFCQYYINVRIGAFGVALFSVYMSLWMRVYVTFYLNPVMKQIVSKLARFVNMLAIAFLFLIVIVNYAVFFTSPTYNTEPFGCTPIIAKTRTRAKWILIAVSTLTFQGLILFSFVYPLYLNHKRMISVNADTTNLIPIIRRAAVTAAVCIVSDLVNSAYGATDHGPLTYVRHMVFSSNLIVNITAVIFSFADWRKRFYPFSDYAKSKPSYISSGFSIEQAADLSKSNEKTRNFGMSSLSASIA